MILKILIISIILNISLLSCAIEWDHNQKEFVFLEKKDLPFNLYEEVTSDNTYNIIIFDYEERNKKENLQEWKKELKDVYSLKEIEEFVYKRVNLEKLQNKEILNYINFVSEQEEYVADNNRDLTLTNYNFLLNKALNKIDTTNSSWLKLRYFYLSLRLAHYYNKHEPLKIYEKYKYLLQNNENSIVKDWIQGLYAGALVKNGKVVNGVYEFTKLFSQDKINWHLSYYNFFHIKTNEQWNELLNLATNSEEKTKFYALRALNENSNILEELQNIYSIDKNSKWFDFILFRKLLNSQHFFDQRNGYKKDIEFLKNINKDNMYLVKLSLSYFNLYEKNFDESSKITDDLLKNYPNSHEVKTLSYILYLEKLEKIDTKIENEIYEKMSNFTKEEEISTSIYNYTFVILEKLYQKQNDKFNAFLANHINYLDISSFDLELLEKFRVFMENPKDSKIKEYFASKYLEQKMIKEENSKYVLDENLINAKTKLLINNLKFEEALNMNSSILNEKIQFNPFNSLIKGNNRSGKQYTMSIKGFLEKIVTIKKELEKNPKSIMDNYLYANALYNLSFFGNSNILTTVYKRTYSFNDYSLQLEKINLAIKHYNNTLNESLDNEFKAKIIYMLAKTELAIYDINNSSKTQDYSNSGLDIYELERYFDDLASKRIYDNYIKNSYGKYFNILKNNFNNTKYYKELIQECANLKIYEKYSK
jgi:hypothetical protein